MEFLAENPSMINEDPVKLFPFQQGLLVLRVEEEEFQAFQKVEPVSNDLGRVNNSREGSPFE